MPTDSKIWDAACERIGLWKRGQVCKGCFFTPHESKEAVRNARWENGTAHHVDHDTPMPTIGDPTAVVAMFEYLIPRLEPEYWYELALEVRRRGTSLALANAVLAVPQETQP